MDILDWIEVGPVSAERDDNLHHYFYDAGLTRKMLKNERQFLLLGRKGAGKTALFRHLERKPIDIFSSKDHVVAMSLNNYSWKAHALLANDTLGQSSSQRNSWRFVLAVETMKILVKSQLEEKKKLSAELKKGHDVLEKLFSSPIPSWLDLVSEKIFRLSKIKLPRFGGITDFSFETLDVSFEDVKQQSSLKSELSRNLEYLANWLESIIQNSIGETRYFLFLIS